MEISKLPPDTPTVRAGTAPIAEQEPQTPANIAGPADRIDIRPLDIAGALQILLAEVQAGLDLVLEAPTTPDRAVAPSLDPEPSPTQASRQMIEMFLQAVPADADDAPQWAATLARVQAAFQSSVDGAVQAVAAWRDVAPVVVDAANETRALVFSVVSEDTQNLAWLRPEWADLAPRIQRFRRFRRRVRRRLADPDYPSTSVDEDEDYPR